MPTGYTADIAKGICATERASWHCPNMRPVLEKWSLKKHHHFPVKIGA